MKMRLCMAALIAAGIAGGTARAFDVFWLPAGTADWNNVNNWADTVGGAPRGFVPSSALEDVANINNGGTATLTAAAGDTPGGVILGAAAADAGTLSISSAGSLTSVVSASTNGNVVVGNAGLGVLNISGSGSLAAPNLSIGGVAGSQMNLSGAATVAIGGSTTIGRTLKITGPNVNFSSATGAALQSGGILTAEITSAAGHSPIKSAGTVSLGGTLNVQFTGVTPAIGNSWNLVDAAAVSGNFANAAVGGAVAVSGVSAPAIGSEYRLRTVNGGTNGKLLQVALDSMLVLRVNRDTGELTIRNPLGAAVPSLDGYTVASPRGSLLSSYKGISGAPAGDSGWEKAPGNSVTGLAEFRPSGSLNVSSNATNLTLGAGFSKTAVASQGLGISGEDLTFTYHSLGGTVTTGQIEYVGTPYLNNIVLVVNTTTGQASLKNDTLQPIALDGYSILSSTAALNGASWSGLGGSFANWQKSPATTGALSETNPVAPTSLAAGQSVSLGTIGSFASSAAQAGLSMKFLVGSESSFRFATISFTSGAGAAGDFNSSGKVDGADFLLWQRNNGVGSLATWKANYGAGSASIAAAAVPEPSGMLLATCGLVISLVRRRFIPRSPSNRRSCRSMSRCLFVLAAVATFALRGSFAAASVSLSYDLAQPTLGTYDQSQLGDDATIPGGTAPGGGTYNSQAYTDNAGPVGQTFTAPAGKHLYALTAISVKGVGDAGGGSLDSGSWALRISQVSGTNLTEIKRTTAIAPPAGSTGSEWYTISLSGSDVAMLLPNVQYAFELYSTNGWFGVDATQGDAAYAGGTAFNSAGPSRDFSDNTLGNLANHGYDRTFIAQLTAPAGGPGDVNNSGGVDVNDYNIIKANLETSVSIFTNGDLDGNSFVDLNDFRRWRAAAPPAALAAAGIPEPSTVALAAIGAALATRRSRRRVLRRAAIRSLGAAVCLAYSGLGIAAFAVPILGLKFAATDPDAATSSLNPADVAGVIPNANWNNLAGSSGSGVTGLSYDNGGVAVGSTVSVTWTSPNTWRSGGNNAFPVGPDRMLLSGYLDTGNASNNGITITLTGLDAALRGPAYDVYVYFVSDSNANRGGGYRVNDGTNNLLKYGSTQGSPTTFVEDPGTDADNSLDGNYLRFRGLTGSSVTITSDTTLTSPNGFRAPINAIQIVSVNIGPGDVNEDGFTTAADYAIIKGNFFQTAGMTRMTGDLNVDGRVDLGDYAIWRNNAPAAELAAIGVPEPAAAALAATALGLLIWSARRRLETRAE